MKKIITKRERREKVKTLVIDVEGLNEKAIEILRNLVSVLRTRKVSEEERDKAFLNAAGKWKDTVNADELIKNIYEDRLTSTRKEPKL